MNHVSVLQSVKSQPIVRTKKKKIQFAKFRQVTFYPAECSVICWHLKRRACVVEGVLLQHFRGSIMLFGLRSAAMSLYAVYTYRSKSHKYSSVHLIGAHTEFIEACTFHYVTFQHIALSQTQTQTQCWQGSMLIWSCDLSGENAEWVLEASNWCIILQVYNRILSVSSKTVLGMQNTACLSSRRYSNPIVFPFIDYSIFRSSANVTLVWL